MGIDKIDSLLIGGLSIPALRRAFAEVLGIDAVITSQGGVTLPLRDLGKISEDGLIAVADRYEVVLAEDAAL